MTLNQTTENDIQDNQPVNPVVTRKRGISLIWILPLVALLIATWLFYKSVVDRGPVVDIDFHTAEGIFEGKTKVIYKGLEIGTVSKIILHPDLSGVTVRIDFDLGAESVLKDKTLFWLVKPRVSLSGVSGLDTLMTGHYIAIRPGKGKDRRQYTALTDPPPMDEMNAGLHIKLQADKLGSVGEGAQVLFRQVPVGKVQSYQFSADEKSLIIDAVIEEKFAHLVKKNSRFWNTSGITVKGSLSGVSIQTESVVSMLAGGIAFNHPNNDEQIENSENGDVFKLYADFDSADVGIPATIYFSDGFGIQADKTKIMIEGVQVGTVKSVQFGKGFEGIVAEVTLNPTAEALLRADTKFWLVKPSLSLSGLSNIGTLLSGEYISVSAGKSDEVEDYFVALDGKPMVIEPSSGLHLQLRAPRLGSITTGIPVSYRQLQVGEVLGYVLDKDNKHFLIDVLIQNKYAHLVNKTTRFWNVSGVEISGAITQLKLKSESLATILAGGIAFDTKHLSNQPLDDGAIYELFPDFESSQDKSVSGSSSQTLDIVLQTDELGSLKKNAPVYYRQIKVGEVNDYQLSRNGKQIRVEVSINSRYRGLVKQDSRFWNASGIEISGGLAGLSIKTQSLASIVDGGIAFFNPENSSTSKPAKAGDQFLLHADFQSAMGRSVPISIIFNTADGLIKGTAIRYKGITIGQVKQLKLINNGQQIEASALLDETATEFAREGAQFWLVGPSLGLLKTEHLETLVSGKFIAMMPGKGPFDNHFRAVEQPTENMEEGNSLHLLLHSARLGSIKPDNPVYYRQIPVGRVIEAELSTDATHVIIHIQIKQRFTALISSSTRFWNVSGFHADFGLFRGLDVNTESLLSLVNGGIAFATPKDNKLNAAVSDYAEFKLNDQAQDDWLEWAPTIQLIGQ